MKALVCSQYGPIDNLRVGNIPSPVIGSRQVRVKVKATSINFPDILIVQGLYQVKPALPFSPGAELAGVVTEVGADVSGWTVGDRVMASTGFGAFAQECVVDSHRLIALPESVDFVQGAALVVAYGTSLHALKECAKLKPGERILILGAAGGVGSAAIQIAKKLGAYVIAAASSDEKTRLCSKLGADAVINYSVSNLRQAVDELTDGRQVDVVYDPVGGDYSVAALRCLTWRGRHLVVGFAAGTIPLMPLNLALLKERQILGVYWGDAIKRDPQAHQANMNLLKDWLDQGVIAPVISQEVSLDGTVQAMLQVANRQMKGKIVIRP